MSGISGIISAFWNSILHLLNSTAKLSGIIHQIYAEYIVFPMATHLLDWRGVLYIRHIPAAEIHCSYILSSSNWPFCAWVHRIAHYLILGWKISFSVVYLECYKQGSHITKQVFHILVMETNIKMLCICMVSDFPRPLVPIFDCVMLFSHPED